MELTNACNHRCVFCGNHEQKRKIVHADKDLFFSIIDEAFDLGTSEIGFYMNGEPLLAPDLIDYIKYSKRKGFEYIYLTTNGSLLSQDLFENLVSEGLSSLKFSINAATRETYKKVHGRDDFEKVKDNVLTICNVNRLSKRKIPIFITFIHNKLNHDEIEDIHTLFDGIVDNVYVYDVTNQGGFNKRIDQLLLKDQTGRFEEWPCRGLFNRIHVTSQGYLDACCADYDNSLALEDLRKVSLKEAWSGDRSFEQMLLLYEGYLCG